MPIYTFECKKCGKIYDEMSSFDESGKYSSIKCPSCKSIKKEKKVNTFAFNFANPVGTDRYENDHDYRFHTKLPKAMSERETASKKQGDPGYNEIDDITSGKHFGDVK